MKKEIGLWIDSQKAVVVILTLKGEVIQRFSLDEVPARNPEEAKDRSSEWLEFESQRRSSQYYKNVVSAIRDGNAILIFGPGNAKDELEKQMQRAGLEDLIVDVQTNGEMTDRQISAKVNRYFPNNRRPHYQLLEVIDDHSRVHEEI